MNYFLFVVFGAAGAIVKDIVKDGYLLLPHFKEGKCYLGFIGGAIIGAFVGVLVDHSLITSFMAGYAGVSVIENLINKGGSNKKINVLK